MENRREHKKTNLEILKEEADAAYARLLQAQLDNENEERISFLDKHYKFIQSEVEKEERSQIFPRNQSSTSLVTARLSQHPVEKKLISAAKPLREFSNDESVKINNHYNILRPDLKALFDAALNDSQITMETIKNPVFIKGEGYIYDLSILEKILEKTGEAIFPRNNDRVFTKKDIIPCNTLITAMLRMLNIIEGRISNAKPVEIDQYIMQMPENNKQGITIQMIKMIEKYYNDKLEPKHRVLFDAICRDSSTNMIMQNPVFLPDGYAYDENTVLFLLEAGEGKAVCPNADIEFTQNDISPCPLAVAVLEQLKMNIENSLKEARQESELFSAMNSLRL
jgi:hypothetical protein